MRLIRRNSVLVLHVKARQLRYPIVVLVPLAMIEELVRALTVLLWFLPKSMRDAFPISITAKPWTIVVATRKAVAELRALGPFKLVEVVTPRARVVVRLI